MNNLHDVIYISDVKKLDDDEFNFCVCQWDVGEKMFFNPVPVIELKNVFVFTKEELNAHEIKFGEELLKRMEPEIKKQMEKLVDSVKLALKMLPE